ncbi:polymer-forming cytoskeletal protein [Roseateles saccharophilus]|uniref:DUF6701 domain-containing protein n=1 Tax=Roseateles saccharophilus TaxID=304 RepID=A0A4R3URD1_ROSSA|nr:polymer-forming cytoskeletal protein [Roseateles saccharophilus]MDG0833631.1 hypothetical protein [Roseateles saccharophilus]TCU93217.1 hypothetical protein EV671_101915 [Roseateles saccharophilus]
MKRWLGLLLAVACSAAGAVNYSFPSYKPAGCWNGGGGTYYCSSLTLAYGDTISISGSRPATINISGNLSTNNAVINAAGNTSDLNLVVSGTLTLGYQASIKANVTAGSVNDAGGGAVLINGNLTATAGDISLAYKSSVTGSITGSGVVTTGQSGSVGGGINGGTSINVSDSCTVSGNINTTGTVSVGQSAVVTGNVSAGSGAVSLGYQSQVNGNISTTGAITLAQASQVGGLVNGGAGNVDVGYAATVAGNLSTSSGTINIQQAATLSACVQSTNGAAITLGYQANVAKICCGGSSCGTTCVANNSSYPMPALCSGSAPTLAGFSISGTGSASTCQPQTLTLSAKDASGNTLTGYTGTVLLTTSSGRGTWAAGSGPAPSGTLTPGGANSGTATYTFSALDAGIVKLTLAHSLAQSLTVNVVDTSVPASSSTSAAINFSNNAFVWAEDLNNNIAGSNIVVAGRNHDLQVSLIKKDPSTGSCGVATDFSGTRNLKLWRTDNGGPWTAPSVSIGANSYGVPGARPTSNNLSLAFSAGFASMNLVTSDVGKYTLNLDDDSLTYASGTISGGLGDLTVRPFTLAFTALTLAGTANPAGSAATDGVFGAAGAAFSATVSAYRWSASADSSNTGVPSASATLAQVSAAGLAPGFNATVSLSPASGSQTPSGGVLGTLSNGNVGGFSGGSATATSLAYSEVGSFLLNTTGVVSSYLGTAGLSLNAVAFNAAGSQQTRVGRFVPGGFALSAANLTQRSDMACSPAASFTYLDENFLAAFTLTAQTTTGTTTQNYTGGFAKLGLTTPANLKLAGISGTTMFKPGGRVTPIASTGSWSNGVAAVTLQAKVARASAPDGPFDTAQFGIAPLDSDNVGMLSLNLDTDSPPNGVDATLLGTIPLRHGRLRLQNAIGAAARALYLPIAAQYWNGSAFTTNTLDNCTRISAANINFGNLRKSLAPGDAAMSGSALTLSSGTGRLALAAPAAGHVGSLDLSLALDSATPPGDQSCLSGSWTPIVAATQGAHLTALRAAWCGSSYTNDPGARATWGLYRGADGVLFQRENY